MYPITITKVILIYIFGFLGRATAVPLDQVPTLLQTSQSVQQIRVKIFPHDGQLPHKEDKRKKSLTFRSSEECMVFSASSSNTEPLAEWLMSSKIIEITIHDSRLPIWIRCEATVSLWAKDRDSATSYRGDLYVREVTKNRGEKELEVINVLNLEEYLRGVLPSEVYPNWPIEALKSQAVAARTYSLYHILEARMSLESRFYDVDDTVRFQAYSGASVEHASTNRAIELTQDEVLTYKNAIIPAFYHADSGGMTARGEEVWKKAIPFVRSRKESFIPQEAVAKWQLAVPLQKVQPLLNELAGAKLRDVVRVFVRDEARTKTGRVRFVSFHDAEGQVADLNMSQFRRLLGQSLPSTLFNVNLRESADADADADKLALTVSGHGFGHGVGLSQRGAAELGKRIDWDYRKILDYYYRGIELCRFVIFRSDAPLPANLSPVDSCKMGQSPISAPSQASKNLNLG